MIDDMYSFSLMNKAKVSYADSFCYMMHGVSHWDEILFSLAIVQMKIISNT